MALDEKNCPIWGGEFEAQVRTSENYDEHIVDCSRCGGKYRIDGAVNIDILNPEEKARLTTWLVDQRAQGNICPTVDAGAIAHIKNKASLPVHERAERLLRFLAERKKLVGAVHDTRSGIEPAAYAWSESTLEGEISYFIDYLLKKGWLHASTLIENRTLGSYEIPTVFRVTVDGHSRIADQFMNVDSSQAFVAMWFDESMEEASRNGIEPAIVDAGYVPMRIDKKQDVRKIDDEIVAQIRRSRFLVADCTHGETKSRGSVYWEAGFAYGLGIEVIYTCRKHVANDLPFDTRQYPYILWETPEDLRRQLRDRILARIGEGPGIQEN